MTTLDRSRDFGMVSPPWMEGAMDRLAFTAQDGKLFDKNDYEIIPGVPGPVLEANKDEDTEHSPSVLSVADLVAQADSVPFAEFNRRAKKILGSLCPASKEQIVAALSKAQSEYDQRQAKHGRSSHAATAQAAKKPTTTGGVDLAAWGRGQRDYLFSDVRKALRSRFSSAVTTERDAVDLLVSNGVVEAAQARKVR